METDVATVYELSVRKKVQRQIMDSRPNVEFNSTDQSVSY